MSFISSILQTACSVIPLSDCDAVIPLLCLFLVHALLLLQEEAMLSAL